MVDFHGCNEPTGMERTYPNIVGMDGVRGMEFFPAIRAARCGLPFTRMLAGLADYTPVYFGSRLADTTWARQVANAVILQSPLLVYSAHPFQAYALRAIERATQGISSYCYGELADRDGSPNPNAEAHRNFTAG